jgi:GNAT superfamily N-acetyltransferase
MGKWLQVTVKFELGCEFDEFCQYYESVLPSVEGRENGLMYLKQNPEHLIVWREIDEIVGHAIWHHSTTDEHQPGNPRDEADRALLRKLFDGRMDIVELHEVWLKKEHRGKGYGAQFFAYFEEFMRGKHKTEIAYYAYNPAALAICRKRGYKLGCCLHQPGFEGTIEKTYVIRISL